MILVVLIYKLYVIFANINSLRLIFVIFGKNTKKTVIGVTKIAFFCAENVLYDIFLFFLFRIFAA